MASLSVSRSGKATQGDGRAVSDKLVGNTIYMSEGPFDYYEFIVRLNQENQFDFPVHSMVSLTYHGLPSPWPVTRGCTCIRKVEQGRLDSVQQNSALDSGSTPASCHHCQVNVSVEKQATKKPENPFTCATVSTIEVMCHECNGVQCSHSKQPGTRPSRKLNCHSSSKHPIDITGHPVTLPEDSVHQCRTRPIMRTVAGGNYSSQREESGKRGPQKSRKQNVMTSISCTCKNSGTSKKSKYCTTISQPYCNSKLIKLNEIVDGSELECTHGQPLCSDQLAEVATAGSRVVKARVPSTQSSAPKEKACTSLIPERPHAKCCRVIRLSEREHLLLRRLEKAKNWCQKLNTVLEQRGMRIFLLDRSCEVHVRGTLNFDHTRIQVLKTIRYATAWWDLIRYDKQRDKKDELANLSKSSNQAANNDGEAAEHEENMCNGKNKCTEDQANEATDSSSTPCTMILSKVNVTAATGLHTSPTSTGSTEGSPDWPIARATKLGAAEFRSAGPLRDKELSTFREMEPSKQDLHFKCELFPDCQLLSDSKQQSCHRVLLQDKQHETLLKYDDSDSMIQKVNGALRKKRLSICLLKLNSEVHLLDSGLSQDREYLLQLLWEAALDTDLQHKLQPIIDRMRSSRVQNVQSSSEKKENNGIVPPPPAAIKVPRGRSALQSVSTRHSSAGRKHGSSSYTRLENYFSMYCRCSPYSSHPPDKPENYYNTSRVNRKGKVRCYSFPFDRMSNCSSFFVQLLKGNIMGKINSKLALHGFAIGFVSMLCGLHIKCPEGDVGRACRHLLAAAKHYKVDQYLRSSFEKIKTSSSYDEFKASSLKSPYPSSERSHGRTGPLLKLRFASRRPTCP